MNEKPGLEPGFFLRGDRDRRLCEWSARSPSFATRAKIPANLHDRSRDQRGLLHAAIITILCIAASNYCVATIHQ